MSKNIIIVLLSIGLAVCIYFLATNSTTLYKTTSIDSIPTTSLEEKVCEKVIEFAGDCSRILLYDSHSKLVFAESSFGIYPVLTNKEFTDVKKFLNVMDFQEFYEEREEKGPIDWRAENNVQKDFSVIYGFAEDDAKTIVINSEGNIQPNKFYLRNHLWVWYATFPKKEVKLPVEVTVYNSNGQIIYDGDQEE